MLFTPGTLVALIVAAFFVVTLLILFVAALLHKGRISSFIPLRADEVPWLPAYFFAMSEQASEAGFSSEGVHLLDQTRAYAWFWLSTCGKIMAVVTTSKSGWIRTNVTLLASRLENGAWLLTTDQSALFQWEFAGLDVELILRANFKELCDAHNEQLATATADARVLSAGALTRELQAIDLQAVEGLEKRGYVRFLDPLRTVWRYTVKGALQCYFQGWLKTFRKGLAQCERANRNRPGD